MADEILEGWEALTKKFQELPLVLQQKYLVDGSTRAGELIRAEAARRAPRGKTGKLAANMTKKVVNRKDLAEVNVVIGPSKEEWYGRFPEFGTVRQKAQPYLRPAFDLLKDEAMQIIADSIKDGIEAQGE